MRKNVIFLFLAMLLVNISSLCANEKLDKKTLGYLTKNDNREHCKDNLKQFYSKLQSYAKKHNGSLPKKHNIAGLSLLEMEPRYFACTESKAKKYKDKKEFTEENSPFVYFGGINLDRAEKDYPKLILMCDKPDSRHLNVLYADGTVATIDLKKAKAKIRSTVDIVTLIAHANNYPTEITSNLLKKARNIDDMLGKSK